MKKGRPLGIETPWDIAAAVLFVLLAGNFLVSVVLAFTAMGLIFLEPAPAVATAALLLLGILCHLATRRRTARLWRRLLLAGIAANFLIVAFFVLAAALMLAAWANLS